jgi:hypothetical protein
MYQEFNCTGTGTAYRDFHAKLIQLATSGYFGPTNLAVTNGGNNYTDGDVLTIHDAGGSGLFDCTFAVNVQPISGGKGPVVGIKRILNGGAFSNRLGSATINAGGTGYAVGDILQLGDGTTNSATSGIPTEPAKVKVATISGGGGTGPVTSVTVFNGGGSYAGATAPNSPPLTACATISSIGLGTGTGCTLNLTMIPVLIPIGLTPSGGTGTGATFGGSLAFSGWSVLRSKHNYSFNSVTDESEVILQGTAQANQETPIVGFRTATHTTSTRNFIAFTAFSAYNSLSSYDAQPNAINPAPIVTPAGGQYVSFIPSGTGSSSVPCFISGSPRSLRGVIKNAGATTTTYQSFYLGLLNPYGTALENPWPMVVMGSHNDWQATAADSNVGNSISGITECFRDTTQNSGPCVAWSQANVAWVEVYNAGAAPGSPPYTVNHARGVAPVMDPQNETTNTKADYIVEDGAWASGLTFTRATGQGPTRLLKPTPSALGLTSLLLPVTVIFATEGYVVGTLDGVFFVSGYKDDAGTVISPEDLFVIGTQTFKAFPNGSRVGGGSWFVLQMGI